LHYFGKPNTKTDFYISGAAYIPNVDKAWKELTVSGAQKNHPNYYYIHFSLFHSIC